MKAIFILFFALTSFVAVASPPQMNCELSYKKAQSDAVETVNLKSGSFFAYSLDIFYGDNGLQNLLVDSSIEAVYAYEGSGSFKKQILGALEIHQQNTEGKTTFSVQYRSEGKAKVEVSFSDVKGALITVELEEGIFLSCK